MIIVLFAVMTGSAAWAKDTESESSVRDVYVHFWLIDVEEVDSVSQSFIANLFVGLTWNDPTLAHSDPDSIGLKMEDIWYPRLQFLNQQRLIQTFPHTAEVRPNGDVIYRQRYWGGFSQPLQLAEFPFDTQRLQLTLVNTGFGSLVVVDGRAVGALGGAVIEKAGAEQVTAAAVEHHAVAGMGADVTMAVDQAGHDQVVAGIDFASGLAPPVLAHVLDDVVPDDDHAVPDDAVAVAVKRDDPAAANYGNFTRRHYSASPGNTLLGNTSARKALAVQAHATPGHGNIA